MNLRDVVYTYDIALLKRKGLFGPICQCGTVSFRECKLHIVTSLHHFRSLVDILPEQLDSFWGFPHTKYRISLVLIFIP